ncbi:unnamed protein product [Cunninghamella echinulata]
MTTNNNTHSFDACSLRSSSLLIVHHEQQVIVTASDELFDLLGYHSGQLIEQPLSLLSFSTKTGKQCQRLKIRHAKTKQWIKLQICIHHDPFSTSSGLDYCLVALTNETMHPYDNDQRRVQKATTTTTNTNVNLIGLNSYGTIIHAYPTFPFPQSTSRQLIGRPIMAFVHNDDILPLCQLLRKCTSGELYNNNCQRHEEALNEATLSIRWLYSCLDSNRYEWMQLTVVNPSIYHQVPSLSGQPICLLRPIHSLNKNKNSALSVLPSFLYLWDSIENGKLYCHEFINHVILSLTQLIYDLIPTRLITALDHRHHHSLMMIPHKKLITIKETDLCNSFMDAYSDLSTTIFDFISTIIHTHIPNAWLPDPNSFDFLKPILPQTKTPSS